MPGAGKKRAKAARSDRTGDTGEASTTAASTNLMSSSSGLPGASAGPPADDGRGRHLSDAPGRFDGPPSSSAGHPSEEGRGRRMSSAPSHHGSRAGSAIRSASVMRSSANDQAKRLQLNRNVDYPAHVYNMYSQSSSSVVPPTSEPPRDSAAQPPSEPSAPTSTAKTSASSRSKPKEKDEIKFRNFNIDTDKHEYDVPTECAKRPGLNTTGQAVAININSFPVQKFSDQKVYQFDVLIGSGVEKRGLIMAIWESNLLQSQLGKGWVFDGNRLAWHFKELPAKQYTIDLDMERGIQPRPGGRLNSHKVQIRPSAVVNLGAIDAYLRGTIGMDNSVLQAIDFLDHLMRVTPSKTMIAIKRSFFHQEMVARESIGGGIEAMKGVYQSIRTAHGGRLIVNVDVSNSCFWGPWHMWLVASQVTGVGKMDLYHAVQKVKATKDNPTKESVAMIKLRKLKKVRFQVRYRGASAATLRKVFVVKDFSYDNCYTWKFLYKNRETQVESMMSIFDYFQRTYDIHLESPTLPVVETAKKNVAFPMEVCYLIPGQRYPYKIDDVQTAKMIKFAVTRPAQRRAGIEGGLSLLNWNEDPYLRNYGVKISDQMLETQARLLVPPVVEFSNKTTQKPGFSGRWRLDGQKFYLPNPKDLVSWGVCVFNSMGRDSIDAGIASTFIRSFVNTYKSHGGRVSNANPPVISGPADVSVGVEQIFNKCVALYPGTKPQILVFLLGGKDSYDYMRIKKSCDCRFGVVSQCMQNAHVRKVQGQYISNVLMKFNAKLGGTTARVPGPLANKGIGHLARPTIIVGADVSHASPGSMQPSMAAVTCSMDPLGCRYAAACESNGHRVEIISQANMEGMLNPLFIEWMSTVGKGKMPMQLMYFRDGVSEGQFQHVLQQEVLYIKRMWRRFDNPRDHSMSDAIKFTVVVASKRHHIRFFPKAGSPACDKNGNPHPGTLVEKDVTHPFEYDFYLNSHSAIQGTARPTHYQVLLDEAKIEPSKLQNMIYEHCYQYMRSTTPVSIFPAVYYAHLASNRARSHEQKPASTGPHKSDEMKQREELIKLREIAEREGKKLSKSTMEKLNRFTETETPPLIKMKNDNNQIMFSMWYI